MTETKDYLQDLLTDEFFAADSKDRYFDEGGPAFPGAVALGPDGSRLTSEDMGIGGMTVRDKIAIGALQGMISADGNDPRWVAPDTGPEFQKGGGKWMDPQGVALQAYEIADAMIFVRGLTRAEFKIASEAGYQGEELQAVLKTYRDARKEWESRQPRKPKT